MQPQRSARSTAAAIPTATLEVVPEHGHISILDEMPKIAAELARHVIAAG